MEVVFKEFVDVKWKEKGSLKIKNDIQELNITVERTDIENQIKDLESAGVEYENLNQELKAMCTEYNLLRKKETHHYKGTKYEATYSYLESVLPLCDIENVMCSLMEKKVLILGLGGIGTVVLDNLLRMGMVPHVVDFDKVEVSNLNRQLYYNESNIGDFKTEIIKGIDPRIEATQMYVKDKEQLINLVEKTKPEIIVSAIDSPHNIEEILNGVALETGVPTISAGVGLTTGFWGPLKFGVEEKRQENVFRKPLKGSNSSSNMIIASLLSHDIILYLIGYPTPQINKRKIYNFLVNEIECV